MHYLIVLNDDWKCDSSNIHILNFQSNIDSLPGAFAKEIFKAEVVDKVRKSFDSSTTVYHREIERSKDSTVVRILNEKRSVRKTFYFSEDSTIRSLAQKKIVSYFQDSTIVYLKNPSQGYVYLLSKTVIRK